MNHYSFDISKTVGAKIKDLRKQSGLSQVNFCKALNMSPESRQTIAKWESGKTLPPIYSMVEICNFFGCDIGYLFGDHDYQIHGEQYIHNITGLSEKSVKYLKTLCAVEQNSKCGNSRLELLNNILESKSFDNILAWMLHYVENVPSSPDEFWCDAMAIFCHDEAEKHNYTVVHNSVAARLYFDDVCEKLKKLLDQIAKKNVRKSKAKAEVTDNG